MDTLAILALVLGSFAVLIGLTIYIWGFRPIGIAAGSCAACCQSAIGNVVKGSCFAIMTCLAMRGYFIALTIVGLLILTGVGIYLLINSHWFKSACDWVQNIVSSKDHKASPIIMEEKFRNVYSRIRNISFSNGLSRIRNISFSNGLNSTKGFLHWW